MAAFAASITNQAIDHIHTEGKSHLRVDEAVGLKLRLEADYPGSKFTLNRYGKGWAVFTVTHVGGIRYDDTPSADIIDLFGPVAQNLPAHSNDYEFTSNQPEDGAGAVSLSFVARHVAGYHLADDALVDFSTPVTAFDANMQALATLATLQAENRREATPAEADTLVQFTGWGTCAEVFDEAKDKHADRRDTLRAELGADAYRAAERGILTSYFTPPAVIRGVYHGLQRLGFAGGRVLEPACGTGSFFSLLPDALRDQCDLYGVELDPTTGQIARALHPKALIGAGRGFETLPSLPPMQLVVGNPPYLEARLFDQANPDLANLSMHNFFLVKSLRMLAPGGLLAFVISRHFMDSTNTKARAMVADMAELLGAVRLPSGTFHGTEAVADIVVLQRRFEGDKGGNTHAWIDTDEAEAASGQTYSLNEYFLANPDAVIGEVQSIYNGSLKFGSLGGADIEQLIVERLDALLPEGIEVAQAEAGEASDNLDADVVPSECGAEPYCFFELPSGGFGRRLPDIPSLEDDGGMIEQWERVEIEGAKPAARMRALIGLRSLVVKLVDLENSDGSTTEMEATRDELNQAYDAFQAKHGYIHEAGNSRVFRSDARWSLLLALECDFDAGVSPTVAKRDGVAPRKPSATKAQIFTQRVSFPARPIDSAETLEDALTISLASRGYIDADYVALLLDRDIDSVREELSDSCFECPIRGHFIPADEYGSGDVKHKLKVAEQASALDDRFARNVAYLQTRLPETVKAEDINISLASRWLPEQYREAFIEEISGGATVTLTYDAGTDTFDVSLMGGDWTRQSEIYGTEKANLERIIAAILSQNAVKVTKEVSIGNGSTRRVVDPEETLAAQEKVEEIKEAFEDWIFADLERRAHIEEVYNDQFNRYVEREYDGSHLLRVSQNGKGLAGMSDDITLRTQQCNGTWRFLCQRGGLADHVVGAGKTFLACAVMMEMRRLQLARKPMAVVPNHLVDQWAGEWQRLYPGAKLLVASKRDFEPTRRGEFFSRIATESWDGIIVPMSSFELIPPPWETMNALIKEEVDNLAAALIDMNDGIYKKRLEKRKAKFEEKLEKIANAKKKQMAIGWDDLGIDYISVDESHLFKNLAYSTAQNDVAGLGDPEGSQRAFDMLAKVRHMQANFDGIRALFLTGTPIANSMAELYTLMRYLVPAELKKLGVAYFDAWAAAFGEITTEYELDSTGAGYKLKRRFAKFTNMPELMALYRQFADVVLRDDLHRLAEEAGHPIKIPAERSGGPINVVVKRGKAQEDYMNWLVHRSIRNCQRRGRDNMLRITNEARLIGLDPRTLIPGCDESEGGKLRAACKNIVSEYRMWDAEKGTQLVFCDLAVPRKANAKPRNYSLFEFATENENSTGRQALEIMDAHGDPNNFGDSFNVYDELKRQLVAAGIPADEIAFIHDYKTDKQKGVLFEKVRQGIIRVLMGSTSLMGTGMNVQDRIVAMHHLEAPWRPADMEQRDGRAKRSGNVIMLERPDFTQAFYRYATEQTYDARMWQLQAVKGAFIEQARQGAKGIREMEDVSAEVANAQEMKAAASGNPLILEEVELASEIRKLKTLKRRHTQSQRRMQNTVNNYPERSQRMRDNIANIEADMKASEQINDDLAFVIDGHTYEKAGEASFAFMDAYRNARRPYNNGLPFATLGGFTIRPMCQSMFKTGLEVVGPSGAEYSINYPNGLKSGSGAMTRVRNLIDKLPSILDDAKGDLRRLTEAYETSQQSIGKAFKKADELAEKEKRHREILIELDSERQEQQGQEGEQEAA
jgi:N12 class adenine-specific DNA methylase